MKLALDVRSLPALTFVLAVFLTPAAARAGQYDHEGTFVIGGGVSTPVGEGNPYLNSSGSFYFGAGRNLNRKFALQAEYTHHWLAIDQSVIDHAQSDSVQITDAHASLWSMTLNGVFRFNPDGDFVSWVTAGGGYYKRNLILTQNVLVYYPPIWDPWWGWIDGGWGPGESIVGKRQASGFGFNVGFGIDIPIERGTSLVLETRYHHAFMDKLDMQLVPVMVSLRW
jgi:Outer membrane protein beta-barrel domain